MIPTTFEPFLYDCPGCGRPCALIDYSDPTAFRKRKIPCAACLDREITSGKDIAA